MNINLWFIAILIILFIFLVCFVLRNQLKLMKKITQLEKENIDNNSLKHEEKKAINPQIIAAIIIAIKQHKKLKKVNNG